PTRDGVRQTGSGPFQHAGIAVNRHDERGPRPHQLLRHDSRTTATVSHHRAAQTRTQKRQAVLVNLMRDLDVGPLIDEGGEMPGPEAARGALSVHAALSSA